MAPARTLPAAAAPAAPLTTKERLGLALRALASGEVTLGGAVPELPAQPGLVVCGKPIALPVLDPQLYDSGMMSPHGRGMETVVDPAVRSSREFRSVRACVASSLAAQGSQRAPSVMPCRTLSTSRILTGMKA